MAVQERLYTAAELLMLPHDSNRYELVQGHLIEMSPTGDVHGRLTMRLAVRLAVFAEQHALGQLYGAETGFKLSSNPDTVYGIDVALVSKARLKPATEGFFDGAPDLAVEVVSPGNTRSEMHEKVIAYFQAGARLVWIVYPKSRAIYVYLSPQSVTILGPGDVLSGGDVLPGFSLPIAEVFSVLD